MLIKNNLHGSSAISMGARRKEDVENGDITVAYDSYMRRVNTDEWESSVALQKGLRIQALLKTLAQSLYSTVLAMGIALAPTATDDNIRVVDPSELGFVENEGSFHKNMTIVKEAVETQRAKVRAEEARKKAEEEQVKIEERAAKLRAYENFIDGIDTEHPEIIEKYKGYDTQKIYETVLKIAVKPQEYTEYEKDYILYKSLKNVRMEIKYLDNLFRVYKKQHVLEYFQKHLDIVPLEVAVLIPYLESRGNIKDQPGRNVMQIVPIANQQVKNISTDNKDLDVNFLPDNLEIGLKLVEHYADKFGGDIVKGVAAYNAGDNNVRKYNGTPPFKETQNYVNFIMIHQEFLEKYPDAFESIFKFKKQ